MTKETRVILKELEERICRIEKKLDAIETDENPKMKERQLKKEITKLMRELGIPANLLGYYYIRETIILILQREDSYVNQEVKVLYPDIAKKFNTTWQRVERAIRHCIEVSFTRGNLKKIDEIFGYTISFEKGRPTNSEFLFLLADEIENKIE